MMDIGKDLQNAYEEGYKQGYEQGEKDALYMAIEALEQETVSKETYTHEYCLRKKFEMKAFELERKIANDMAIDALKDRPKGKWLEVDSFESEKHSVTDMRCSLCGKYASIVLPHGNRYVYDFCPNCGADMRVSKKIENKKAR